MSKQKREKKSNGHFGFAVGLVVGTFLGAGIATLLAPASGDQTRARIQEQFRKKPARPPENLSSEGITVL